MNMLSAIKSQRHTHAPTIDWIGKTVLSYCNPDVVERIQKKLALSSDNADILFDDMLMFLSLCSNRMDDNHEPLVPPKKIDEAWHHFLLFTKEYEDFCETYFGGFLHHQPSTSKSPLRGNRIAETIALAKTTYGDLSGNWSTNWLDGGTECGATPACQVCYKE